MMKKIEDQTKSSKELQKINCNLKDYMQKIEVENEY